MTTLSPQKAHLDPVTKNGRAKIITVFSQKGGSAKTQNSMQLGGTLGLRGHDVLIVDMDSQGTAVQWSANADDDAPFPATVVSLSQQGFRMVHELRKLEHSYEFIIIDCPPNIEDRVAWAALHVSHLALIPVIPLLDNLWTAPLTKEKALRAQIDNPDLQIRYVPSRVKRGVIYDGSLKTLRRDTEVACTRTELRERNSYPESQLYGSTVHRMGHRAKSAIEEVDALASEVLEILFSNTHEQGVNRE